MNRLQKSLILIAAIAVPAAAHSTFAPVPESLCFASGATTYQIAHNAAGARLPHQDCRCFGPRRSADATGRSRRDRRFRPGRRLQRHGPRPCRSSTPIRTVTLDAGTAKPDVTVNLSADAAASDYKIYVHSVRYLAAGRRGAARRDVEDRPAARSDRIQSPPTADRFDAVSAASTMPAVRRPRLKGNRKVPRAKIPANTVNKSGRRELARPNLWGQGDRRSMQVRPVTGTPRKRYRFVRRLMQALLRWTFIVIGALATASVLFAHLYRVNESIYDPSLFAIGDRRPVLPALRRHADGAVAQQPSRHGTQARQDPLRGAGRQHLGIEGGGGAGHEPARSPGRSDRPPRQPGPHHLRQRRLLRLDRRGARGAARHHRCAAVAAAGPHERAAGRHAAARRADHDRRRRALARLARRRGLGREGRARRSPKRRPRRHRPHRGRARAGARRATPPRPRAAPSRASSPWCRTRSARR